MRDEHFIERSQPALYAAFREAKMLIDAGNGFRFRIRTNSGDTFDGIPPTSEPIECPANGLLRLEIGSDLAVIPARSIETITVIACA